MIVLTIFLLKCIPFGSINIKKIDSTIIIFHSIRRWRKIYFLELRSEIFRTIKATRHYALRCPGTRCRRANIWTQERKWINTTFNPIPLIRVTHNTLLVFLNGDWKNIHWKSDVSGQLITTEWILVSLRRWPGSQALIWHKFFFPLNW